MASEELTGEESINIEDYDPELDFYSDTFNPLKALKSVEVRLPAPEARPFDNLAKYESVYLKERAGNERIQNRQLKDAKDKDEEEAGPSNMYPGRRFLPHQMPILSTRRLRPAKNVLVALEEPAESLGPLSLLKMCLEEKLTVKIWTRHLNGIRGYCTGKVLLFDKHWNVCLENVHEIWTRPKKRKRPAFDGVPAPTAADLAHRKIHPPSVTILKANKKFETCERNVDQLLIRGEQIAVIVVLR